ncbi:MAG: DUF4224 domain-containing protein [Burkholderiaceae bacterium]|nr:DUF4224 domain-containing protein [Burkholderiaceae bacterium]
MDDLILSPEEIFMLTRYRRPHEQLRALGTLGIPAHRMHDNTVRVLRMHLIHPTGAISKPAPQRKSARR